MTPPPSSRFTRPRRFGPAIFTTLGLCSLSTAASAQPDVEKPLSNVLLLVDTSGSMEFKTDGNLPECNPGETTQANERSRWIDLVEVLTGSVEGYSCYSQERTSVDFKNEFSLAGHTPYDFGYVHPYTRMLSNSCGVGPGVLPAGDAPWEFPDRGINTFRFSGGKIERPADVASHSGCSGFAQRPDGILDIFSDRLRFGLMTFDTHLDSGTGLSGGNADHSSGLAGTWSYYVKSPSTGRPANCAIDFPQEVGARNYAAPPWEGRMVAFGASDADVTDADQRNRWIQEVLLATRPYGATPIAGLLDDARKFLLADTQPDPFDRSEDFGPYRDPAWLVPECRKSTIVLLSDGEPNLDLRPHCENTAEGGRCPYETPEDIAYDLLNRAPTASQAVETLVIGFALSTVTPSGGEEIPCAELTDDHCVNNPTDRAIQACCTLNEIAAAGALPDANGDQRKAYFPQDRDQLREAFAEVLSQLSTNISTRTSATFASAAATTTGGAFQFNSGFVPSAKGIWKGSLTRTRTVCADGYAKEQSIDPSKGDDFIANVNSQSGTPRRFYTAVPEDSASNSLRPRLSTSRDGIELSGATMTDALSADDMVQAIPASALQVTKQTCNSSNDSACRDLILSWTLGLTNADGKTRCSKPGSSTCNLVGGIFHSTPKVVSGRPAEALRDESYQAFVATQAKNERPSTLYVSSVDGFLHAFKVAPFAADADAEIAAKKNNLLWSFIPPAVLPVLQAQYPDTPATLLDGEPMIKDVVARQAGGQIAYERTSEEARSGSGEWRTVLVQGFGKGQVGHGYFALDVTDPDPAAGGPELLWQLTRDSKGNELFGVGGTPLITTLYLGGPGQVPKEVAVAVLPGGDAGSPNASLVAGGSARTTTQSKFAARTKVRSYSGANEARSLTLVRLDTGEVIRSFRGVASATELKPSVVELIDMPAPIVGTPVAYPGRTGNVADRIFVGDREGRLWVVDVSSTDPDKWLMKVFFDAFWDTDSSKSQPIETPPTLSVDEHNNVVVIVSTGNQRVQSGSADSINRVVSLTEVLNESNAFETKVNWVEDLGSADNPGERVTGRMSLFDSTLYFSSGTPPGAFSGACDTGSSRIWGVHYNESVSEMEEATVIDPLSGAAPRLPNPADETKPLKTLAPRSGIIFGVGIEQQPSCTTSVSDYTGDPYSGLGSYTAVQDANPGKFFLVYQVGGTTGSGDAGKVTTVKTELDPPKRPARIDSWALISE